MAQLKITGVREIDKALRELEPKIAKKVLRQAMRKSMKVVQKAVKENVPVDEGQLRDAIKVRAGKRSRKGFTIEVQIGEGDFVGDTYYGAFQEYGTSKMEGKGFMRKAFDETAEQARKEAIELIRKGIEKEADKAAK